ncbi:hypothetical protein SIID45300_02461 [Candidatus Magnetaquicoccaceae bacterium FCR-1]|uniref:Cytochrome c domain-containing protein n=1 Tax=Candidatus Magnetaquiglobus chichijimensis TaxID=3141448 RepID=A0ABQ0CB63_9PROT
MNGKTLFRGWFFLLMTLWACPAQLMAGTCLECHRERDGALVAAWEKSRHAQAGLECESCHGAEHDGAMARRARPVEACVSGCHERERSSYTLSKHGVIAVLEGERLDFSLPLKEGNQRSPSCAYCHLHDKEHDAGSGILPLDPAGLTSGPDLAARIEARAAPCRDCHSPRFVETWFSTGDRMVEIGRMKVREAEALLTRHEDAEAEKILARMKGVHLSNVRLGVGHASPDDQWWHGHPALDGDLLRIKSRVGEILSRGSQSVNTP